MPNMRQNNPDGPFLAPIEDPQDPVLRQIFAAQERYLGKVITPSKVHSARLPPAFAQFYGMISELDSELQLSPEMAMLIRSQVARLNVCLFCMDSNRAGVISRSMDQARFDALDEYDTSPLFTESERSALDYVTRLTRDKKADPDVFGKLALHYSEREICEIVYLVASEHVYNITNVGLNIHSDMLCDLAKKTRYEHGEHEA